MKKTRKMKNYVSWALPIVSILIIISFAFFGKPTNFGLTGLTTYIENSSLRLIDADVTLTLNPNEIVPENSIIKITLDDKTALMPVSDFIKKTGQKFEYIEGRLEKINYNGFGYTGDYSYNLNITDFNITTTIEKGYHLLVTEIVFDDLVLYRNEKTVFIN